MRKQAMWLVLQTALCGHILAQSTASQEWFSQARFGIWLDWGLHSLPQWIPAGGTRQDYHLAFESADDTWSPAQRDSILKYHQHKFGDRDYSEIKEAFIGEGFSPNEWIRVIRSSGAKYVLLPAKAEDGFAMWDASIASDPGKVTESPIGADVIQQLLESGSSLGCHWGLAFSLFEPGHAWWHRDPQSFFGRYAIAQLNDLMRKFNPELIWLTQEERLDNEHRSAWHREGGRFTVSKNMYLTPVGTGTQTNPAFLTLDRPLTVSGNIPWQWKISIVQANNHPDLVDETSVYSTYSLVQIIAEATSKGGNVLLQIPVESTGRIPLIFQQRLRELGQWLEANRTAIFDSQPWKKNIQWAGQHQDHEVITYSTSALESDRLRECFFTTSGSDVFAIVPGWKVGSLRLTDLPLTDSSQVIYLPSSDILSYKQSDPNTITLNLPDIKTQLERWARILKITHVKPFVATPTITIEENELSEPSKIILNTPTDGSMIFYTTDNSEPTTQSRRYVRPFIVKEPCVVKARAFADGKVPSEVIERRVRFWQSLGDITLHTQPAAPFNPPTATTLIDGEKGTLEPQDGRWIGFNREDFEMVIDLGEVKKIQNISFGYLCNPAKGFMTPSEVVIEVSKDGFNYTGINQLAPIMEPSKVQAALTEYETRVYNTEARYVYILARNPNLSPEGNSWLLIDELEIE